jgi:hypothetical protein
MNLKSTVGTTDCQTVASLGTWTDTDNQGIMNFRPFTRWVFEFGSDQIPYHSVSVHIRAIRGKIRLLNLA